MIGLFFFVQGLSSSLAAIILFAFSKRQNVKDIRGQSCGFWYYFIFLLIAVLTFVVYIVVSRWYKNRQRGELEESEQFYRPERRSNTQVIRVQ